MTLRFRVPGQVRCSWLIPSFVLCGLLTWAALEGLRSSARLTEIGPSLHSRAEGNTTKRAPQVRDRGAGGGTLGHQGGQCQDEAAQEREPVLRAGGVTSDKTGWTGRLLWPSGEVLAGTLIRVVQVGCQHDGIRTNGSWVHTNAEGRFEIQAGSSFREAPPHELRFCLQKADHRPLATAVVRLHSVYESTLQDLGDIYLYQDPILARGMVVDEFGGVIEGALVVPQFLDEDGGEYIGTLPMPRETRGSVLVSRGRPSRSETGSWMPPDYHLAAISQEDGRFELRGSHASKTLRLEGHKQGLVMYVTPPFAPGMENVLLVLRHVGRLRGSLIRDPLMSGDSLRIELSYREDMEPSGTETPLYMATAADEEGQFDFQYVPAGVAELHVYSPHDPDPLVVIREIAIPMGSRAEDSRLQGIDLRGTVIRIRLRIVDESGCAIPHGWVHFLTGVAKDHPTAKRIQDGWVDVLVRPGQHDFLITGSGFLCKKVGQVSGDRTVTLEPGIPVTLSLPANLPLPSPPLSLHVSLIHSSYWRWHRNERIGGEPFEGYIQIEAGNVKLDRTLHLIASAFGEYAVRFWIEAERSTKYLPLQVGATLNIKEGTTRVQQHIAPDFALYEEALSRLEN